MLAVPALPASPVCSERVNGSVVLGKGAVYRVPFGSIVLGVWGYAVQAAVASCARVGFASSALASLLILACSCVGPGVASAYGRASPSRRTARASASRGRSASLLILACSSAVSTWILELWWVGGGLCFFIFRLHAASRRALFFYTQPPAARRAASQQWQFSVPAVAVQRPSSGSSESQQWQFSVPAVAVQRPSSGSSASQQWQFSVPAVAVQLLAAAFGVGA